MNYEVNKDAPNVSTTLENDAPEQGKKGWSIDRLYEYELTTDNLIDTLRVTDVLKKKYPNDETIVAFEDIIRFEICHIFGGITIDEQ